MRHPNRLRVGALSAHAQLLAQSRTLGTLVLAKLIFRGSGFVNALAPRPYGWWHLACDVSGSGIHVSADQWSRPLHSAITLTPANYPLSITTPPAAIARPPFFSLFLCFAPTLPYLAAFSLSFSWLLFALLSVSVTP